MKFFLQIPDDYSAQVSGPMTGHRVPYLTILGVPAAINEFSQIYSSLRDVVIPAEPGMVVCDMYTRLLYAIDLDCEGVLLPIKVVDAKVGLADAADQISVYTEGQVAEMLQFRWNDDVEPSAIAAEIRSLRA